MRVKGLSRVGRIFVFVTFVAVILVMVDHSCSINRTFTRREAGHFRRWLPAGSYRLEMAYKKGDCMEHPPNVGPYSDKRSVLQINGVVVVEADGVEVVRTDGHGRFMAGGSSIRHIWRLANFHLKSSCVVDVYFEGDIASRAKDRDITVYRNVK